MIKISLFCVGLYIVLHDFFTFLNLDKFEDYIYQNKYIRFFYKPILGCPACMGSFWSFVFLQEISLNLVVTAFGVAGLNTILYNIYKYLK